MVLFILVIAVLLLLLICYLYIKPYFSPLKHLPEPKPWPFLGHTPDFFLTDDHIGLLCKWSEQFEKEGLFKTRSLFYGRETVHVIRTEWAKYMWQHPDLFRRTDFLKETFPLMLNGLLLATGENHRFQKKILSKAFSKLTFTNYVPVFDKHADQWIQVFKSMVGDKQKGENIDVRPYTNNFSFNILGEIALGYQFNSEKTAPDSYIQAMKRQCDTLSNVKVRILLGLFPFLKKLPFIKEIVTGADGEETLNEVLIKRRNKVVNGELTDFEKTDLLSIMMTEVDDKTGKMFTDQQIRHNCFTFMLAGYETTASAIPVVLYHLSQYQDVQEKVRKEVLAKIGHLKNTNTLKVDDVDLPYLSAVIKESLRFFPVVSSSMRQTVQDCNFGDYKIPKDTFIFLYTQHMNRDPEQFDYPDKFMPERFMSDSDIKGGTILTFGYGPYSCIGKTFALLEMRVMLARMLQNFRFTIDDQYNDKFTERKQFLTVQTTPEIIIRFHKLEN